MKTNVELPIVRECAATQCAYNAARMCHARAITVGHATHPACDTFLASTEHAVDKSRVAGVGACKVSVCKFNQDFECTAEEIRVGYHEDHADCVTFTPS